MNTNTAKWKTVSRLPCGSWLPLAVLVFFQLAWAGHVAQHDGIDLSETCATCLQIEQNGAALPSAMPAPPLPVAVTPRPQLSVPCRISAGYRSYESRAPPRA